MNYKVSAQVQQKLTEMKINRLTPEVTAALGKLEQLQLYLSPRPKNIVPEFPNDISVIANNELSKLLGIYTQWEVYAGSSAAATDSRLTCLLAYVDTIKARKYTSSSFDKSTDRKFETVGNREVRELQILVGYLEALLKMQDSVKLRFERYTYALSRELTRRTSTDEKLHRSKF